MSAIVLFLFVLALGCIGVVCLFFADHVQRWVIKSEEQRPSIRVVASFIRSPSYLISVRAVGVIAFLMGGFLLWAQLRNS